MDIIHFVLSITDNLSLGLPQIRARLEDNDFFLVSGGCYKYVYTSKQFPDYVVKVFSSNRAYRHDSSARLPPKLRRFWLKPIFQNAKIQIQARVNDIGGSGDQASKEINVIREKAGYRWQYDLHSDNCRYHNGDPVIIDYSSAPRRKRIIKFKFTIPVKLNQVIAPS